MTPMNTVDIARARRLLDIIEASGAGEVSIYVGDDTKLGYGRYVSVEVSGRGINTSEVDAVFQLSMEDLLIGK